MPPDDAILPLRPKYSTSSFVGVFRSLSTSRTKSSSAVLLSDNSDPSHQHTDGHTSGWSAKGIDSMHRGSVVSSSSDASGTRDFDASIKTLAQRQNLNHACDEAEQVVKSAQYYTLEQALVLWEAGSHLLHNAESSEARRSGSLLLVSLAGRQDLSPAARRTVFEAISESSENDVIPARAQSLISLADHGRRLEFSNSSLLPLITSFIVPIYEVISSARAKARKAKVGKANGLAYDDSVLDDLLQFAIDLITLHKKQSESDEVQKLLDQIFIICRKTSVAADIKQSLAVFDAVILYRDVPDGSFVPMLELLCSIHASVRALSGPTARAVRNLAKSKRQDEMVDTLRSFLLESTGENSQNLNVLRGAVFVFADLIRAHGEPGVVQLQFEPLMDALQTVAKKNDGRLEADVLELCLNTLEGEFAHQVTLAQNWAGLVRVLNACSARIIEEPVATATSALSPESPVSRGSVIDDIKPNILANIVQIASAVGSLWDSLNGQQIVEITNFLSNVCQHIEPTQAELILNTMRAEKLCDPQSPGWVQTCQQVINCFVRDNSKPAEVRIVALETLKEAFASYESLALFHKEGLFNLMLETFSAEDNILFLESLISFIVDNIVPSCDDTTFEQLVDIISSSMAKDLDTGHPDSLPVSSPERRSSSFTLEVSLANVCTMGLVRMFLRSLNLSAAKAVTVYQALLKIAESPERPLDARLTSLKMLFRLRCDASGSIIVIAVPEDDFRMSISGRNIDSGYLSNELEDAASDHMADNDFGLSVPQRKLPIRAASTSALSRSTGRSTSYYSQRLPKLSHPVWAYTDPQVLPEAPPDGSSPFLYAHATPNASSTQLDCAPIQTTALKANVWLESIIILLQRETSWDIYSYVLTHLAAQLQNKHLFDSAVPQIKLLRSILCDQIKNESFREPPINTGVKKSDVAGYIFDSLCVLISYHEHFAKSEEDELVRSFMMGIIGSWGSTSRGCIHALSVCCHEIPLSVTKALNQILDKISKVITLSNVAVHILEFLALLARLPEVYINLREEEIRTVFGICIRLLQTSREQKVKTSESPTRVPHGSRTSSIVRETAGGVPETSKPPAPDPMSTYIYTSTHHVMVFWFLSLKLQDRAKHVNWITSRLIFADEQGKETVEEQSQVFLDLMQRAAFSDLGETIPFPTFPPTPEEGTAVKKSWIVGMSIVTVETAGVSGLTQITKRQASGTTYAVYQQRTAPVLPHQVPATHDAHLHSDDMRTNILPSHVMLQLTSTAFPTPIPNQPIPLPDDDMTRRALSTFDRNDIVDGHKIGVIYIEDGQTTEAEILSNTHGSPDYEYLLSGLGTKVSLKEARFNTQGLHAETDGEFTYAWRDRVTEIVYHVTTMMPTNFDNDPSCVLKKSHIGNDFVNIIFNHSNTPFNFDTIPSQFNFFNIVISPVSRLTAQKKTASPENMFYSVKVMSKPGLPEISPAASPKVISGKNLAPFVRILALNASVFSLVWNSEGEHMSSWRNRLREIKRLRERVMESQSQSTDTPDATYPTQRRGTKANIYSEESPVRTSAGKSEVSADLNTTGDAYTLQNLDFSRWAR